MKSNSTINKKIKKVKTLPITDSFVKYPGVTLAEEGVSERSVIVDADSLLLEIVDSLQALFWKFMSSP